MEAFAIKSAVIAGHSLFINAVGDIYVLVRNSATHPQVNAVLNELDLSADLKVVESLIIKENSAIDHDDPLHISIEQVNEMVQKIKHELEEINKIREEKQKNNQKRGELKKQEKLNLRREEQIRKYQIKSEKRREEIIK